MSQENVETRRQADRDWLDRLQMRGPALSDMLLAAIRRTNPGSDIRRRMVTWAVGRGFEAMRRSDVDLVVMFYEPDAEVRMNGAGGVGISERYNGHEGIRELYADLDDAWGDWAYEVRAIIDGPDQVAVRADFLGRGRSSGAEVTLKDVGTLVGFSNRGKVARQDWFVDSGGWHQALEAAGLRE